MHHCSSVCAPDGKVHHCVQFVPPTSIVRESLQVNHQDARQGPQIKLFGGLLVFLTCWTVPKRKNKKKAFNSDAEGVTLNNTEAERSSPGVMFSERLHGRKELDALL